MKEKKYNYSIIFNELDKLSEESDLQLTTEEVEEYEEIRTLREIVSDIQNPTPNYVTST